MSTSQEAEQRQGASGAARRQDRRTDPDRQLVAKHEAISRVVEIYVSLVTRLIAGLGLIGFGVSELAFPDFIPIATEQPEMYGGIGVGLVAGKQALRMVAPLITKSAR